MSPDPFSVLGLAPTSSSLTRPADLRAEGPELFVEPLVAAVEVVDVVDHRFPLGRQAR